MTPTGLKTFQALPEDGNKRTTKKFLKDKFLEIASSLNIDALGESGKYIPAIFENYISFWNEKIDETITLRHINGGY